MTETLLPISPEVFWGIVYVSLFFIACLVTGALLSPPKNHHRSPLTRLKGNLGLRKVNSGLFLIALMMWCVVAFLLVTGLIWTVWGIIWQSPPTKEVEPWDWPFALVKLTALTATLGAVVAFPITMQRLRLTQLQTSTASEALFNDKIKAAANDLHAQRQVTVNVEDATKRADIWQDDIVKRNAAIDQLEILVQERPDTAPRIARMLSTYVRELSKEFIPLPVPAEDSLKELRVWARSLKPCRSDMENAVQTLGRLKTITGVDPNAISIDLRGANLQGFDLNGAVLEKANLIGANLQNAQLEHAKLKEILLSSARMQGASLRYSDLQSATLLETEMQIVNLSEVDLRKADLSLTKMQSANLSAAQMQGTVVWYANLQGAILTRTAMDLGTWIVSVDLLGAMLRNFDYSDVEFEQIQTNNCFYDGSTIFSDEITRGKKRRIVLNDRFQSEWLKWQKSIGFDPDTYQA